MKEFYATVTYHGDPSVGIFGWEGNVPVPFDDLENDEREFIRENLRGMYSDVFADGVDVTFSDEWSEEGYPLKS